MSDSKWSRRTFLAQSVAAVAATSFLAHKATAQSSTTSSVNLTPSNGSFTLPELEYAYDALAPHIDAKTMEIHHSKHHKGYVDKLNDAVKSETSLAGKSAADLLKDLSSIPESVREAVRNNGGGHVNHSYFWALMTPGGSKEPVGELAEALHEAFGNQAEFRRRFEEAGTKQFGSGWAWLVYADNKLEITSTPNQDNPLSDGKQIVLGNDVWEHAYYLNYQNRRADYLKAWWKVLNWDKAEENFQAAKNKQS